MKRLLFNLKRYYLRYSACFPKHLDEKDMLTLGKNLWTTFIPSKNNEESTLRFQSYAFTLNQWERFSLQEFLREYSDNLENNRIEHSVGREEEIEAKQIELIKTHLHAIC